MISLYNLYTSNYNPMTFQLEILNNLLFNEKNLNIRTYRQSGLSTISIMYILTYALNNKNKKIMWISQYESENHRYDIMKIMHDNGFNDYDLHNNKIMFPSGSVIHFSSFSNYKTKCRGNSLDLILCDSVNYIDYIRKQYDEMLEMLTFYYAYSNTRIITLFTGNSENTQLSYRMCKLLKNMDSYEYPFYHNPKYDIDWQESKIKRFGIDSFIFLYH